VSQIKRRKLARAEADVSGVEPAKTNSPTASLRSKTTGPTIVAPSALNPVFSSPRNLPLVQSRACILELGRCTAPFAEKLFRKEIVPTAVRRSVLIANSPPFSKVPPSHSILPPENAPASPTSPLNVLGLFEVDRNIVPLTFFRSHPNALPVFAPCIAAGAYSKQAPSVLKPPPTLASRKRTSPSE
jgi:hypothetical protein